jgi:predicted Zn-dependent protease
VEHQRLLGFASGAVSGVVAASLMFALRPVGVVSANFGSNTASGGTPAHHCDATTASQCIADNGTHIVFISASNTARTAAATRWVMTNVYEPVPDITTSETADSRRADLIVQAGNFGLNGIWAWTACSGNATFGGADPNRYCRPQNLNYNLSYPTHYDSDTNARAIACHEFGHSLGLRHSDANDDASYASSCMLKNQDANTTLTSHDRAHLTAHY